MYAGTTWELLATDKYLRTTTGNPLSTGGSNSISIQKANLPAVSVKVNPFSVTTQPHTHEAINYKSSYNAGGGGGRANINENIQYMTSSGGGQNTGTASPSTENLGSGTPITVTPTYITIRAWKRLS